MKNQLSEGQDSFLDIVANLVGILIILVVLVGAHSANQSATKPVEPTASLTQQLQQIEQQASLAADTATKLHVDNQQLEQQISEQNQVAASLTERRHLLLVHLERVKRATEQNQDAITAKLAAFDEATQAKQKHQIKLASAQASLENELQEIQQASAAFDATVEVPKTETLVHYPNPIAKTVFAEEIHFRLAEGKLTYVPLQPLIDRMKSQWRTEAEGMKNLDQTIKTVGPIDGYRMQYQLSATDVRRQTEFGAVTGRSVSFQQFRIIPQPGLRGESVAEALADGSQFRQILSRHEPRKTTVSVWLYPDGFSDHHKIKTWLYENGYQMASWPLKFGRQISGGPNGFKTSAQ